jgi:hypothetical protein
MKLSQPFETPLSWMKKTFYQQAIQEAIIAVGVDFMSIRSSVRTNV